MSTPVGAAARRATGRAVALLAVVLLGLSLVVAPQPSAARAGARGAAPAAAPVVAASASGVRVELEQVGPAALVPGSQLLVRVRVENLTDAPVSGVRARLFVDSPVLADRSAVTAWAAGEGVQGGDRFTGVSGAEQPLSGSLAPGASTEVSFSVDADELRLGSDFGPRGITVDVLDSQLQRLDALRSFLVWMPQGAPATTAGLTVLAPVTGGVLDVSTGQLPEASVDALTGPDGRLSRLLLATAVPSATLVLDPALLGPFAQTSGASSSASSASTASAASSSASPAAPTDGTGGQGGATTASSSPTTSAAGSGQLVEGRSEETSASTQTWLAQLEGRTSGGVAVLPRGDTDVQGTVAAQTPGLLQLAVGQAVSSATETTGTAPSSVVLSPADSTAAPGPLVVSAAQTAAAAAATVTGPATRSATATATAGTSPSGSADSGATGPVLLLDADSVSGAAAAGVAGTAPGVVSLTTTAGDGSAVSVRAVLADGTDSALLAQSTTVGGSASTTDGSSTTGQDVTSPAATAARLLADTAVAALSGSTGSALVLALPRAWDPDPSAVSTALGPVGSAPWVRSSPLADLLASAGSAPSLAVDPSAAVDPSGDALPADGLQAASAAVATAQTAADLVTDRSALLDPVQRSAVAAASLGWRSQQDSWRVALTGLSTEAQGLSSAVAVVPGSPVFAINKRVNLPVTVRNSLSQEAVVTVQLRSNSYRLLPGAAEQVTIPAGSQVTAQLPVRALASGDSSLTVLLRSPVDGRLVGVPAALTVRVRADWEGRGVAAAAAAAVLVLVGGVVRTVVRVRRRPRAPVVRSAEEADGDAPPRPRARETQPPSRDPEEADRG